MGVTVDGHGHGNGPRSTDAAGPNYDCLQNKHIFLVESGSPSRNPCPDRARASETVTVTETVTVHCLVISLGVVE